MNGKVGQRAGSGLGLGALAPIILLALGAGWACEEVDLSVPNPAQVEEAYIYSGELSAAMNGNVAEVTIVQPDRHLQRGGTLWAKVGPYVLLFSEETEGLFKDFPGLAGVRVVTRTQSGREVARALLARDELNDITWRRALNIAGLARRDGTRRPALLEDLVEWGEEHTEYSYDPRYSRP